MFTGLPPEGRGMSAAPSAGTLQMPATVQIFTWFRYHIIMTADSERAPFGLICGGSSLL
jgi:hypothetical protein